MARQTKLSPDEAVRQKGYAATLGLVARGETLTDTQLAAIPALVKRGLVAQDARDRRRVTLTDAGRQALGATPAPTPVATGAPTPAVGSGIPSLGTSRVTRNPVPGRDTR